jgi:hypothetical protein
MAEEFSCNIKESLPGVSSTKEESLNFTLF